MNKMSHLLISIIYFTLTIVSFFAAQWITSLPQTQYEFGVDTREPYERIGDGCGDRCIKYQLNWWQTLILGAITTEILFIFAIIYRTQLGFESWEVAKFCSLIFAATITPIIGMIGWFSIYSLAIIPFVLANKHLANALWSVQ